MSQERDPELSQRYRAASDQAPPTALDALIRAAAHRAAAPARNTWQRRWGAPLALAASVVLGLGVVLRVAVERPDLQPAAHTDAGGDKVASPSDKVPENAAPATATPTESAAPPALGPGVKKESTAESHRAERPVALPEAKRGAGSESATGDPPGAARDLRVDQAFKRGAANTGAAPAPTAPGTAPLARMPDPLPQAEARVARDAAQEIPALRERADVTKADAAAQAGAATSSAPPVMPAPAASALPQIAAAPRPPSPAAAPPTQAAAALPPAAAAPPPVAARPPPLFVAPAAKPPMAAAPSQDQTGASERRAEPATAARAKALANADSADAANIELGAMVEARLLPEEWLRRIIAQRRAGRHGEADASLQRFMQRFPDLRVPDDARLARP